MSKFIPFALILSVGIGAIYFGYDYLKKRDLDIICEAKRRSINLKASVEPEKLNKETHRAIEANIFSSEIRAAYAAISKAQPNQRYALYQKAAQEIGYDNWQCPAMAQEFEP